jgi:hypothetical protein
MSVPCDPIVIDTDGTGSAAGRQIIVAHSLLDDWDNKFAHTFQEYRIRAVTFDITSLDDNSGVTMFSISEQTFGIPNYDQMTSATNWIVPNSTDNPRSHKVIRWKAIDLQNLEYLPTSGDGPAAALNWFTNNTTFNSEAGRRLFVIRAMATVEFRGIGTDF